MRKSPIIQKYLRGYQARESISIDLHKMRMKRQLREQDEMFSSHRNNILESMQVLLAYLFRRRKARRDKAMRESELAQIQQAEADRVRILKEKRIAQQKLER